MFSRMPAAAAFRNASLIAGTRLYPTVSLHSEGAVVRCNFSGPFRFDIAGYYRQQAIKIEEQVASQSKASLPPQMLPAVLLDFLLHYGYADTYEALRGSLAGGASSAGARAPEKEAAPAEDHTSAEADCTGASVVWWAADSYTSIAAAATARHTAAASNQAAATSSVSADVNFTLKLGEAASAEDAVEGGSKPTINSPPPLKGAAVVPPVEQAPPGTAGLKIAAIGAGSASRRGSRSRPLSFGGIGTPAAVSVGGGGGATERAMVSESPLLPSPAMTSTPLLTPLASVAGGATPMLSARGAHTPGGVLASPYFRPRRRSDSYASSAAGASPSPLLFGRPAPAGGSSGFSPAVSPLLGPRAGHGRSLSSEDGKLTRSPFGGRVYRARTASGGSGSGVGHNLAAGRTTSSPGDECFSLAETLEEMEDEEEGSSGQAKEESSSSSGSSGSAAPALQPPLSSVLFSPSLPVQRATLLHTINKPLARTAGPVAAASAAAAAAAGDSVGSAVGESASAQSIGLDDLEALGPSVTTQQTQPALAYDLSAALLIANGVGSLSAPSQQPLFQSPLTAIDAFAEAGGDRANSWMPAVAAAAVPLNTSVVRMGTDGNAAHEATTPAGGLASAVEGGQALAGAGTETEDEEEEESNHDDEGMVAILYATDSEGEGGEQGAVGGRPVRLRGLSQLEQHLLHGHSSSQVAALSSSSSSGGNAQAAGEAAEEREGEEQEAATVDIDSSDEEEEEGEEEESGDVEGSGEDDEESSLSSEDESATSMAIAASMGISRLQTTSRSGGSSGSPTSGSSRSAAMGPPLALPRPLTSASSSSAAGASAPRSQSPSQGDEVLLSSPQRLEHHARVASDYVSHVGSLLDQLAKAELSSSEEEQQPAHAVMAASGSAATTAMIARVPAPAPQSHASPTGASSSLAADALLASYGYGYAPVLAGRGGDVPAAVKSGVAAGAGPSAEPSPPLLPAHHSFADLLTFPAYVRIKQDTLQLRSAVRRLVLEGQLEEAEGLLHTQAPQVMGYPPHAALISCALSCQRVLQLLAVGSVRAAFETAQAELGGFLCRQAGAICTPFDALMAGGSANTLTAARSLHSSNITAADGGALTSSYPLIRDAIALLAYPDPRSSPLAHLLLRPSVRDTTADVINAAILEAACATEVSRMLSLRMGLAGAQASVTAASRIHGKRGLAAATAAKPLLADASSGKEGEGIKRRRLSDDGAAVGRRASSSSAAAADTGEGDNSSSSSDDDAPISTQRRGSRVAVSSTSGAGGNSVAAASGPTRRATYRSQRQQQQPPASPSNGEEPQSNSIRPASFSAAQSVERAGAAREVSGAADAAAATASARRNMAMAGLLGSLSSLHRLLVSPQGGLAGLLGTSSTPAPGGPTAAAGAAAGAARRHSASRASGTNAGTRLRSEDTEGGADDDGAIFRRVPQRSRREDTAAAAQDPASDKLLSLLPDHGQRLQQGDQRLMRLLGAVVRNGTYDSAAVSSTTSIGEEALISAGTSTTAADLSERPFRWRGIPADRARAARLGISLAAALTAKSSSTTRVVEGGDGALASTGASAARSHSARAAPAAVRTAASSAAVTPITAEELVVQAQMLHIAEQGEQQALVQLQQSQGRTDAAKQEAATTGDGNGAPTTVRAGSAQGPADRVLGILLQHSSSDNITTTPLSVAEQAACTPCYLFPPSTFYDPSGRGLPPTMLEGHLARLASSTHRNLETSRPD